MKCYQNFHNIYRVYGVMSASCDVIVNLFSCTVVSCISSGTMCRTDKPLYTVYRTADAGNSQERNEEEKASVEAIPESSEWHHMQTVPGNMAKANQLYKASPTWLASQNGDVLHNQFCPLFCSFIHNIWYVFLWFSQWASSTVQLVSVRSLQAKLWHYVRK